MTLAKIIFTNVSTAGVRTAHPTDLGPIGVQQGCKNKS